MELQDIMARIQQRLDTLGMSASAASKAAGKPDAIRNLQRAIEQENGRQGMSTATLNALAPVLRTTAIWLLAEAGPEELGAPSSQTEKVEPIITGDAVQVRTRFVRAAYGGKVEAGTFRTVDEFDDEAHIRAPIWEFVDEEFPDATLVTFDVVGDSMNALTPNPLLEGFRVACLDFESLKNRAPIRDRMVVVVEQTINGGHLRERSVKQLEVYRDRTEYCPRSTNPKHKPIVVMNDHEADDGREVKILAIVRRITSDVVI